LNFISDHISATSRKRCPIKECCTTKVDDNPKALSQKITPRAEKLPKLTHK